MPAATRSHIDRLEANIGRAVLGKPAAVRMCTIALLAGEHILLEDVPGVGKTLLGKALAKSVDAIFSRIQFTPDLLPSDILGTSIYEKSSGTFSFVRGPVFANVILADEINRTTPRTQSALLEAMSDRQVSADGQTHELPCPFIVIATQNPYEFEGTYPLPESQLDRFLMRISIGYPQREDELAVLVSHRQGEPVDALGPVLKCEEISKLQTQVRDVSVEDSLSQYLLDLIEATRRSKELRVGASTRAALNLYRAAQAMAFIDGRDYSVPDDIKSLAVPVLAHRVIPEGYHHDGGRNAVERIVTQLVQQVPVPR